MTYFAVTREAGPSWVDGKGAFDQPGAGEHAAFMNGLAEQGVVLFAGPLDGSEQDRIRVLLITQGQSAHEIDERLASDPWARSEQLVTTDVKTWRPIAGADRLAGAPPL